MHGVDVGARRDRHGTRSSTRTSAIEPGAQLGVDPEADRERFVVSDGGVVVVGKGERVEASDLRVALLTREYPPDVYGGAGVHVEYLARELAKLVDLTVHCWGADRPERRSRRSSRIGPGRRSPATSPHAAALQAVSIDLTMAAGVEGADVVHSHTWYANLGGHLAKLIYEVPHVVTVHSLEPMRPWKAEQLGGGYALSSFCERTALEHADAVIAVSREQRRDMLACYPAIDPERVQRDLQRHRHRGVRARPRHRRARALRRRPGAAVGRLRRPDHAPEGARPTSSTRRTQIDPEAQLVLCAGAPDTPGARRRRSRRRSSSCGRRAGNVIWIEQMLPKPDVIQLLSHATVFVCPSIYEPLGIVNLEAMACEAAVVATRTGGIPEVVEDGVTGLLVPFEPRDDGSREPVDPAGVRARDRRARSTSCSPTRRAAERFGKAGRRRAVERFNWAAIAERVVAVYRGVVAPES